MSRYTLSAAARRDLLVIWNYVAESATIDVADKILGEIRDGMRRIARFPGLGHQRSEIDDPNLKVWTVRSYLLVYRSAGKIVSFVRVVHGASDLRRHFLSD